jgi:hypothetical protein
MDKQPARQTGEDRGCWIALCAVVTFYGAGVGLLFYGMLMCGVSKLGMFCGGSVSFLGALLLLLTNDLFGFAPGLWRRAEAGYEVILFAVSLLGFAFTIPGVPAILHLR